MSLFYRVFASYAARATVVSELERMRAIASNASLFAEKSLMRNVVRILAFLSVLYNLLVTPFRGVAAAPQVAYAPASSRMWLIGDITSDLVLVTESVFVVVAHVVAATSIRSRRGAASVHRAASSRASSRRLLPGSSARPSSAPQRPGSATSTAPGGSVAPTSRSAAPAAAADDSDDEEGETTLAWRLTARLRARFPAVPWEYLVGTAPLDIISVLPLDYALGDVRWRVLRLLRGPALFQLISPLGRLVAIPPAVARIGQLCVVLLIVVHLLAAALLFASYYSGPFYGLSDADFYAAPFVTNAFRCWYLSVVYLVGYSVAVPTTVPQLAVGLAYALLGASFFALIIGTVGSILGELGSVEQSFRDKLSAINTFMSYSGAPETTQTAIRSIQRHMWRSRRFLEELEVLKQLPDFLLREMRVVLHIDLVRKVKLFASLSPLIHEELADRIQYNAVPPGIWIIHKGDVGKEMYFMFRGEAEVWVEIGGVLKCVAKKVEGEYFGEIALILSDCVRTASVKSKTFCEMFVLKKEKFVELEADYPEMTLKMLRDALVAKLFTEATYAARLLEIRESGVISDDVYTAELTDVRQAGLITEDAFGKALVAAFDLERAKPGRGMTEEKVVAAFVAAIKQGLVSEATFAALAGDDALPAKAVAAAVATPAAERAGTVAKFGLARGATFARPRPTG